MFRIRLLWVGKTRESYVKDGIRFYKKKLKPYIRLSLEEVRSATHRKGSTDHSRAAETQLILQRLTEPANTIFLDEKGKGLSSLAFAALLEKSKIAGTPLTFVVGGAFGFEPNLLPSQAKKICLSEMTLNHQLIRVMFLEQLYRAITIIRGEPYHH